MPATSKRRHDKGCRVCGKTVYPMELVSYDKQKWHKACFRCLKCNGRLSLSAVAKISGDIYCKVCFKRAFTESGNYQSFEQTARQHCAPAAVGDASVTASGSIPTPKPQGSGSGSAPSEHPQPLEERSPPQTSQTTEKRTANCGAQTQTDKQTQADEPREQPQEQTQADEPLEQPQEQTQADEPLEQPQEQQTQADEPLEQPHKQTAKATDEQRNPVKQAPAADSVCGDGMDKNSKHVTGQDHNSAQSTAETVNAPQPDTTPEEQKGRDVSLLGESLPVEDPTDPFDRQRCIKNWRQSVVEEQVALVLGVGGLGCTVAMTLARLGVRKIILLDRDTVDMSNLNRQVLFSKADVGSSKVAAAARALQHHAIGSTEVVEMHLDALKNWDKIVDTARHCTVLFNNIDIGETFDYACISLAKSLSIPYAAGSSYARTWLAEFYTGHTGVSTFTRSNASMAPTLLQQLSVEHVQAHKDLSFLPADINPPTRSIGSNCLVCMSAGIMTVNNWVQSLMGTVMPNFTKFDIASFWEPVSTHADSVALNSHRTALLLGHHRWKANDLRGMTGAFNRSFQ